MCSLTTFLVRRPRYTLVGRGLGLLLRLSLSSFFTDDLDLDRERRWLSWRRRLGLGDPELVELEDRELEDPERLEAEEELEPLEEPELEPELLLELDLLLPVELRRLRPFSLPLSFSAFSLVAPVFSFSRTFALSSICSFLLTGEGAIFALVAATSRREIILL